MKINILKMKTACLAGAIGLTQLTAQAAFVAYNAATPEGNFGSPSLTTDGTAYTTYVTSTATMVDFQLVSSGVAGSQFGNFYISTGVKNGSPGSTVGFEVKNNNVFIPGVPGTSPLIPADGITESIVNGANSTTIDLLIPWDFFLNDPQGLGFDKITAANNEVRLNIAQAFGYSAAGDSSGSGINFGADELGTAYFSPVPEARTVVAGALMLLPFGLSAVRRMRKQS